MERGLPLNPPGPDRFLVRMQIQSRVREALTRRGYREVAVPLLGEAPGADPWIEPMTVDYTPLMEPEPRAQTLFLPTSPEFALKRLLCRGRGRIFQIGPVFRQGEKGPRHSPEFTLAEWYAPGLDYRGLMSELEAVIMEAIAGAITVQGKEINLIPPFPRLTVAEAMDRAGVRLPPGPDPAAARQEYYRAFLDRLEPLLAREPAVFLTDFPPELALLARVRPGPRPVAERFELYLGGLEIANGCTELTDPIEHRRRFDEDRELRRRLGKPVPPLPEAFLADLETRGLPECAGVAVGVERLALAATGAERIEEVQALPFAG